MAKSTVRERAGHYRKVRSTLWGDQKFRELSLEAKALFALVMLHPNMTSLGAMRGTVPGLAAELNVSEKAFREAFGEALAKGMIEVDEEASLITYPNFVRHNEPESPNVVLSWAHVLLSLPECPLLFRHILRSGKHIERMHEAFGKAFLKAFGKAFPKAIGKAIGNTEPEPETDQPPPPPDQGSNSLEGRDGGGGGNGIYEPLWPELEALLEKLATSMSVEE